MVATRHSTSCDEKESTRFRLERSWMRTNISKRWPRPDRPLRSHHAEERIARRRMTDVNQTPFGPHLGIRLEDSSVFLVFMPTHTLLLQYLESERRHWTRAFLEGEFDRLRINHHWARMIVDLAINSSGVNKGNRNPANLSQNLNLGETRGQKVQRPMSNVQPLSWPCLVSLVSTEREIPTNVHATESMARHAPRGQERLGDYPRPFAGLSHYFVTLFFSKNNYSQRKCSEMCDEPDRNVDAGKRGSRVCPIPTLFVVSGHCTINSSCPSRAPCI
jgi:hypothetical protein